MAQLDGGWPLVAVACTLPKAGWAVPTAVAAVAAQVLSAGGTFSSMQPIHLSEDQTNACFEAGSRLVLCRLYQDTWPAQYAKLIQQRRDNNQPPIVESADKRLRCLPNKRSADELEKRVATRRNKLFRKKTFDADCDDYDDAFPGYHAAWAAAATKRTAGDNYWPTQYQALLDRRAPGTFDERQRRLPKTTSDDKLEKHVATRRKKLLEQETFDTDCEDYDDAFPGYHAAWVAAAAKRAAGGTDWAAEYKALIDSRPPGTFDERQRRFPSTISADELEKHVANRRSTLLSGKKKFDADCEAYDKLFPGFQDAWWAAAARRAAKPPGRTNWAAEYKALIDSRPPGTFDEQARRFPSKDSDDELEKRVAERRKYLLSGKKKTFDAACKAYDKAFQGFQAAWKINAAERAAVPPDVIDWPATYKALIDKHPPGTFERRIPYQRSKDDLEKRVGQKCMNLLYKKKTFDAECKDYDRFFTGFQAAWDARRKARAEAANADGDGAPAPKKRRRKAPAAAEATPEGESGRARCDAAATPPLYTHSSC